MFKIIDLDQRQLCDLELLLNGAFHPVCNYMCQNEYLCVLHNMTLLSGKVWTIPITLTVREEDIKGLQIGDILHLRDPNNHTIVAHVDMQDIYKPDIDKECECIYQTRDLNHPGVRQCRLMEKGYLYVGGIVSSKTPIRHYDYSDLRLDPKDIIDIINKKDFKAIVGFQTRNPLHKSHVEVILSAIRRVEQEVGDSSKVALLLHPTIGPTQPGDIDYRIRIQCYRDIIPFLPHGRTIFAVIPLSMRMAGPKEAIWHGLIRKNYGCTHFIIGRDPAAPSTKTKDGLSFYDPYEGHSLAEKLQPNLPIKIVNVKEIFYHPKLGCYTDKSNEETLSISGTELRRRLRMGIEVPEWFSFPNVLHHLSLYFDNRGICIWFTGLSGSGKTTISHALISVLKQWIPFGRTIAMYDGDEIRNMYPISAGFSSQERSKHILNVAKLASKITETGGIAVCSLISPFKKDRKKARKFIEDNGASFVEIYVDTPLIICEERDVKGLYRMARDGTIRQFTGIDSAYEIPENPDLTIEYKRSVSDQLQSVLDYLKKNHIRS